MGPVGEVLWLSTLGAGLGRLVGSPLDATMGEPALAGVVCWAEAGSFLALGTAGEGSGARVGPACWAIQSPNGSVVLPLGVFFSVALGLTLGMRSAIKASSGSAASVG